MKKGKRLLSWLLAVAMVITGVNLGSLTPVKAAEVKSEKYYLEQSGKFYGHRTDQADANSLREGTDEGQITLKTDLSKNNTTGTKNQAPYTSESASGELDACGGQRNGCIVFDLSDTSMDLTNLKSAQVSLKVAGVSNSGTSNQWFKAALYETANSQVKAEDETTYAALAYTAESPIWSAEKLSGSNASGTVNTGGTIHFDVKDVFKAAYEKGDRNIVFRVQAPRAGFTFNTIRLTIDATIPTNVAVKYVDAEGNEIQDSKTVDVNVGSQYTYEVSEDEKVVQTESGVYVYDETSNTSIAEVKENAEENVINLVYQKAKLTSVTAPGTIYAIEGNTPVLPRQLTASTEVEGVTVPVNITWEDISAKEWKIGDNTVTGTAAGLEGDAAKVTATVHVYECDEAVADFSTGSVNSGKMQQLAKEYSGTLVTEYDIISVNPNDPCYSYLSSTNTDVGKAFGNSGPMLHTGQGYFTSRTGDGKGNAGNYPEDNTDVEKMPYESGKRYRVRTVIDTTQTPGNYHIWVTDESGKTVEVTKPEGNGYRTYNDGTIRRFFMARENLSVTNHKISWQSGYATAQIDYYKPDGTKLADSTTSKEMPGASKTIDTSMFTPKSEGSTTYLFDAANSGWDVDGDGTVDDAAAPDTATMPAASETAKFRAVYKQAAFLNVAETIETETLVGKQPILPSTVKAKYEGVEEPIATEVTWDFDKFDFTTETAENAPLEVTGTLTNGASATAKVHVKHAYLLADYTFDGDNPAADSTGRHADADLHGVTTTDTAGVDSVSNGVKLTGGSNGTSYVKLPDDLLQLTKADGTKETQDDFTLSMFINRESQGNSFAMILHATDLNKPYSQGGPKGHLGLINKDTLMDMEYRIGGATKANLTAKDGDGNNIITPVGQWTHIAVVTNGTNNTAKLYLNGILVGTVTDICKPSQLTAQNNYLGRASWDNSDYKATFDDFQVYNGILTEEEIQNIAGTRLCDAPVQDVYNNLAISLKGEGTFDKDAVTSDLNLPQTMKTSDGRTVEGLKITWESNNPAVRPDGTVIQPSKGRPVAEARLKATIQYGSSTKTKIFDVKVQPGENVSFIEFDEAFEEAKAKYTEATASKAVYVQSTIDALGAKLEEAKAVKATENTEAADADEVDTMTAQLQDAIKGVKAKRLAEIGRTLAAWYPLDNDKDKVKDKTNNGKDGTAAASVTFGRENGATFNGGPALANCITLPNDIEIGEQMTFAFWAKDGRGGKSNVFGIGSGDGFGDTKKTDAHFFYVNTYDSDSKTLIASMNPKYWSGATNISTPAAAKDTWHQIVCVLNGTKLTLYMNGRRIETKDVGHTVKEMWDADPGTRHIYIGNCAYGKNPNNKDADYKGSVRDFRIYNAPLAQEQVAEIYEYFKIPEMRYAKDDLIAAMTGARLEDDGTVTLNVTNLTTTDNKLNLPNTSYGAGVTWQSSDNAVINADTGVAAIPPEGDLETEKSADLTATIKIGEGESQITETIVFKCKVFYALDIVTDDLDQAIKDIKNEALDADDYTQGSWTALQDAITAAQKQVDKPTGKQDVDDAQSKLQAARDGLVDISVLRRKLGVIKSLLINLEENDYTETSWDALDTKVQTATTVLADPDAEQGEVDTAANGLPDDISELAACGDPGVLDDAIDAAKALKAFGEAYTQPTWEAFETALEKAEGERAKRIEDYSEAAQELNAAIEALEIKEDHKLEGEVKEKLESDLAAAKAEAETLTENNYEKETWDAYQEALKAFEAVLDKEKATKDEAEAAKENLEEARASLEPVADQVPDSDKKKELTDTYDAAVKAAEGKNPGVYTQESWQRYETALAEMKKIADRLAQEKNNVTKAEIDAAIAELKAAEEALEQNVDKTALDKAIRDYGSLKAADYTSATWNAFKTALDAAKRISAKADATQAEVNAALTTLNAKKQALKKPVKVSKIKISADYTKVAAGKKVTLKASVTPTNAANRSVSWSIDKTAKSKKYASINTKGVLTTNKKGAGKTVTVTATAKDGSGKKATLKIKIMKGGVKGVSLKAKSKKLKAGKKLTVKATVKVTSKKKSDANTKLTWKTSNKKVATVSSKGVVTGKKAGKVTITATSTDGTKKSGKIKLTVTKK